MVFGTLTILLESGEVLPYELEKSTTSIGRQPGNDIVLSTTAVSRYHAQFDVADGQVFLVDLGTVNGTFLNDQQIEPNSRVPLAAGDRITIGDVTLVFYPPEVRAGVELAPEAITVEREGVPFRLMFDQPPQPVAPGARLQLSLIVENLTDSTQLYTLETGGMERDWVKANRRELRLEPYEQTEAVISVRPPRSSQTTPSLYPLSVSVHLKDEPDVMLQAVCEIKVVSFSGLAMVVRDGKQAGMYHVAVQNQGNAPTSIQLGGFHPQQWLRYRFDPGQLTLTPGETRQVTLAVQPRRARLTGPPESTTFAVVARSLDAAHYQAPVIARYTIRPSWTALVIPLIALVGLAALVVAGAVALGIIAFRPPANQQPAPEAGVTQTALPPTPTQYLPPTAEESAPGATVLVGGFIAEPATILFRTQGDVALRWQVTPGLEGQVRIQVFWRTPQDPQGEPGALLPVEADTVTSSIPRDYLLPGEHHFRLEASGAGGTTQVLEASVVVTIPECSLAEGDITLYEQPNEASAIAQPPAIGDSRRVVVLGRDATAKWLKISLGSEYDPDALTYWVLAKDVTFEGNLDWMDFIPVGEGSESAPSAVATAAPGLEATVVPITPVIATATPATPAPSIHTTETDG